MRRGKRFLAIALAISMLFSTEGVGLYASEVDSVPVVSELEETENTEASESTEMVETAETEESTEIPETTETEKVTEMVEIVADTEIREIPQGGYRPLPEEYDAPVVDYDLLGNDVPKYLSGELEASYVTPNLPTIRDQNPYGTCWAFSSISLGELDLMQSGVENIDLSELHLAYFTYNSAVDPLGGTIGDSNNLAWDATDNFMQIGGNLMFTSHVLANWMGMVEEEKVPYENVETVLQNGLSTDLAYDDVVHLKNAYYLNIKENPEIVKAMIKEFGGVGISYYSNTYYYSSEYNSHYVSDTTYSDHAVTIVGWDDTFPKENFITTAPEDGAWLVRNSWGSYDDEYNLYGYFWLSYYDTSLAEKAYAFDVTVEGQNDYYDNNYQYDGSMRTSATGMSNSFTAANVFTVQNGASGETLNAVSFSTTLRANQSYKVEVYKGLSDPTKPDSGTLVATETGDCIYAGIYTVELSESVLLAAGEKFSVVVTVYSPTAGESAYLDYEVSETGSGWYDITASACEGQSYYWGGSWVDYGAVRNGNFRIKAFTNNAVSVTGVSIPSGNIELGLGETATLSAAVMPADAGNKSVTWSSANESVATVDETGKVTAVGYGDAVITATTVDGGFTASIMVSVTKKLVSISLDKQEVSLPLGQETTLVVSYNPEDTITDRTATWSSSDTSIATVSPKVDENGNAYAVVSAVGYGRTTITAKVAGKEATCVVSVTPLTTTVSAKSNEDGSVVVTWQEIDGCTKYYVYRRAAGSQTVTPVAVVEAGTTSYTDTADAAGVRYYYYVETEYDDGNGYAARSKSEETYVVYKVVYVLGGGTNAAGNPTEFCEKDEAFALEAPQHDSAIFEGWYFDNTYRNEVGTINPAYYGENVTVYAKWRMRQEMQTDWLIYNETQDYTGKEIEPEITIKNGGYTLVEGTDYTMTYVSETVDDVNICNVTVTGIGEYIGSQTVTITEKKAVIQDGMVDAIPAMTFNGAANEPEVVVTFMGTVLEKGVDYTVSYENNTNIGTATAVITGIGHFEGTVAKTFRIQTKSLEKSFVTEVEAVNYTGAEVEPEIVLKYNGTTLKENVDYRISYSNNTNVGTATATIRGCGNYIGTIRVKFEINGADLGTLVANGTVKVLVDGGEGAYEMSCTGEELKPAVTLILADGSELSEGRDYTVTYEDNVLPGTAKIIISGEGNYAGTVETTFEILKYNIDDALVMAGRKLTVLYTPAGQKPVPKVVHNDRRLVEGQDFDVVYYLLDASGLRVGTALDKVVNAGTYELVLRGIGDFTGELEKASIVTVKARSFTGGAVRIENTYVRYDGVNIAEPDYEVWYQNSLLEKGVDYTVAEPVISEDKSYATFIFEGKGNYSGTLTQKFPLIAADVVMFSEGNYAITDIAAQPYTGTRIQPEISVVKVDDTTIVLQENVDYTVSYKYNLNVGTATVTVTGMGKCVGEMTSTFEIIPEDMGIVTEMENTSVTMGSVYVAISDNEFTYGATARKPAVTVMVNDAALKEGTDYAVSYKDATGSENASKDAGTYQAVITFQGNYTGTVTFMYEIMPVSLEALQISIPDPTYTGTAILPTVEELNVSINGRKLTADEKTGLTVSSATNNVNVSDEALVTIAGSGNFTGEIQCAFKIVPKNINDSELAFTVGGQEIAGTDTGYQAEWNGNAQTPAITIKNGDVELVQGEDYTVVYRHNTEIGTARVIVTGKDNYQGVCTLFFEIVGIAFTEETGIQVSVEEKDYYYSGQKIMPAVVVTKGDTTLTKGVDYNVSYTNNENAGTAKVIVTGTGCYDGVISKTFTILPKTLEQAAVVKVSDIAKQRYSRELIVPEIAIEMDGLKLVKGEDYTVTALNAIEVGTATLIVTGVGNYEGVLTERTFEIYKTTITYVLNGGVNSPNNPDYYTASDNITFSKPTRDAYNFAGWYSDKACTKRVTGIKAGTNGNKTFYAKWTPKQVYGIDVSKWQNQANGSGAIDWHSVKQADKAFAMVRLSYGTTLDPYFEYNYSGARAAGVKVGVYCYNTSTTVEGAVAQANFVLGQLNGRVLDYPVCLDMEDTNGGSIDSLTNIERTNIIYAFKNIIEAAGYDFILYANKNWMDNKFDQNRMHELDLWIARYCDYNLGHRYTGNGNVRMWQYTDSGTVNGISGLVDLDVCYEDYVKK